MAQGEVGEEERHQPARRGADHPRAHGAPDLFAQGAEVDLEARGEELTWRSGDGPQRVLALHHLFFDPAQSVHIDTHGLAQPGALEVRQAGRTRTLALNRWLTEPR